MVQAADDFNEAVFIAKEIGAMTGGVDMLEAQASHERETRAFSDIAVLCRTHRQLELVESCLRHDDIPCIVSGRESWLEDGSVRGFLAFFRWLLRPDDAAALGDGAAPCVAVPGGYHPAGAGGLRAAKQAGYCGAAAGHARKRPRWAVACLRGEMAGPGRKGKAVEAGRKAGSRSMAPAMRWTSCGIWPCSTPICPPCWMSLPLGRRRTSAAPQAEAGRQALCA